MVTISIGTGIAHHLFELFKVNVTVSVGINGFDHSVAFFDGALHSDGVQHLTEFCRRDEAVLVFVVQIEGVSKLRGTSVRRGRAAEGGKLRKVNETVAIGVKVFHDTLELVLGNAGSESAEDVVQLGDGDLAVAVGIEAGKNLLEFVDVLEVDEGIG